MKQQQQTLDVAFTRVPPQAQELEEAVLGAMMMDRQALTDVIEILRTDSFYNENHGKIFNVIQRMFSRSEPVDILSVTNELRKTGELEAVGGAYQVAKLTERVASGINAEFHARVIAEKAMKRHLISAAAKIIDMAYNEGSDVFESIDEAEIAIKSISNATSGNLKHVYDPLQTITEDYLIAKNNPGKQIGIPIHLPGYDDIVGNAMQGDLIVVAARPSMGKTMTMVHSALQMGKAGMKGIVFSLEMNTELLVTRMVCSEAKINSQDLREGKLSQEQEDRFAAAKIRVEDLPLYFDDLTYDIHKIRSTARKFKAHNPDMQFIMIDYLQKITGSDPDNKNANRDIQIGYFTGTLKRLAKELKIPVILLCQVGRAAEKHGRNLDDYIPNLSELRESGNIEQDADVVVFPFRPAYYGHMNNEEGEDLSSDIWFVVRKNRNGSVGVGRAHCDLITQSIFRPNVSTFTGYNPY